ncbi:MAG: hypothetical protein LBS28_04875 [Streptococcaceae bacterium]|jgi:chromosome segregation ATPase|nr:hypothetical protein [Streptococcaceae bacterium]
MNKKRTKKLAKVLTAVALYSFLPAIGLSINSTNETVSALTEKEIAQLKQLVKEKNAENTALKQQVAEQTQQVEAQRAEIERENTENTTLKQQVEALRQQLQDLSSLFPNLNDPQFLKDQLAKLVKPDAPKNIEIVSIRKDQLQNLIGKCNSLCIEFSNANKSSSGSIIGEPQMPVVGVDTSMEKILDEYLNLIDISIQNIISLTQQRNEQNTLARRARGEAEDARRARRAVEEIHNELTRKNNVLEADLQALREGRLVELQFMKQRTRSKMEKLKALHQMEIDALVQAFRSE